MSDLPPDDPTIGDGEDLLRRIHPTWVIEDQNIGGLRLSSAAFSDSPDGSPMSIVLAMLLAEQGRAHRDALRGHPGYSLAAITAGLARELQQGVVRDPIEVEPAHGLVVGKKTGAVKRRFAAEARWIVEAWKGP